MQYLLLSASIFSANAFIITPSSYRLPTGSTLQQQSSDASSDISISPVQMISLTKDLEVSALGIGTWAWGDKAFWGYNSSQDAALYETFQTCVSKGINFFDTAEIYGLGKSELLLGRFARESGVKVQMATKFAPIPVPWRLSASSVVDACADSNDRLGVSKSAIYQLHWPLLFQNDKYLDGLATCYEKGLCVGVGVSNYGASQLRYAHKKLASRGIPLVTNQISYSLLARSPESNGIIKAANELGVRILAYSPLAQGILTGKFNENNIPTGVSSTCFSG